MISQQPDFFNVLPWYKSPTAQHNSNINRKELNNLTYLQMIYSDFGIKGIQYMTQVFWRDDDPLNIDVINYLISLKDRQINSDLGERLMLHNFNRFRRLLIKLDPLRIIPELIFSYIHIYVRARSKFEKHGYEHSENYYKERSRFKYLLYYYKDTITLGDIIDEIDEIDTFMKNTYWDTLKEMICMFYSDDEASQLGAREIMSLLNVLKDMELFDKEIIIHDKLVDYLQKFKKNKRLI